MKRVPVIGDTFTHQTQVSELLGKVFFEIKYNLETSFADEAIFIANYPCVVRAVREVHRVLGTDAGAVNLQLEKCTGTTVPGSGTNLLTNNSNAGFDLKGTVNTVQVGVLTATAADRLLSAGDRLALDFAGTLTALAGVCVTVSLDWI
jgi:hypothetical protein